MMNLDVLFEPPVPIITILGVLGLITPFLGRYYKERYGVDVSPHIAIIGFGLTLIYSLIGLIAGFRWYSIPTIRADPLGFIFATIFIMVGLFVSLWSLTRVPGKTNSEAFYSLAMLSVAGMSIVGFASDLLLIFVALTLFSVPMYVLVALRKTPLASEAAMKYFVVSTLSTAIFLYSISIIYGVTGTTDIFLASSLLKSSAPLSLLQIAFIMLLAGLGFEMAIVPFHMWIPDAYDGAPPMVAALLSSAGKIAGFAAFIRIAVHVAPALSSLSWTPVFALLSLVTMTWGNVAALTQKRFTRMLAYSSIAHAGYVLIGIAFLANPSLAPFALAAALYHLFNYALMKGGSFLAAASVEDAYDLVTVETYNGLGRTMPLTAFSLTIMLLALAGIPPLNGFFSKVFLFWTAIQGDMLWLAVAMALNSAFSVGYYAWIIKRMYVDRPAQTGLPEKRYPAVILLIMAILIILTGVFYPQVYQAMITAAKTAR